jgi:hypothetical protein
VDQCLLALEADRLEDEIRFNAGELAEAHAAADTPAVARLLEIQRNLNEARRSLDRRRQDTSLLASSAPALPGRSGGHR